MSDTSQDCQLPDDLPFDRWINYVFDHPLLEPNWWWQPPETGYFQEWEPLADPARTISYLTQLFSRPSELIGRFSRPQIDQGLNFLVDSSCSAHMYVLTDKDLPWANRRACIDAMISLYEKLMAPVYGNDLGHTEKVGDPERYTFSCYMWWDAIPLHGDIDGEDVNRINDAVLNVFEQVLKLNAESCLESVLHGLGHWHHEIPQRTELIVRRFLTRSDISSELRKYAELAAVGKAQ